MIYQQAKQNIPSLQKSFEDMVNYHNKMVKEKSEYITKELPYLIEKIKDKNIELKKLLDQELELSLIISKSDSFEELEDLITKINEEYRKKPDQTYRCYVTSII